MSTHRNAALLLIAGAMLAPVSTPLSAADKKPARTGTTEAAPWDVPQPAVEPIALAAYQRIREEGLTRSRVMEFGSALADDIGPRLTGSPNMQKANEWTRDELTRLGLVNAHLEDWGEFGMGWQQVNTWLRMSAPDTAPFIAQATPWSPATNGPVSGEAVRVVQEDEKAFDKYRG